MAEIIPLNSRDLLVVSPEPLSGFTTNKILRFLHIALKSHWKLSYVKDLTRYKNSSTLRPVEEPSNLKFQFCIIDVILSHGILLAFALKWEFEDINKGYELISVRRWLLLLMFWLLKFSKSALLWLLFWLWDPVVNWFIIFGTFVLLLIFCWVFAFHGFEFWDLWIVCEYKFSVGLFLVPSMLLSTKSMFWSKQVIFRSIILHIINALGIFRMNGIRWYRRFKKRLILCL